ncbi:MAG: DUF4910 domain-containing protein [Rhodobacteraceae bacterium]|nr:DUF4910 domain-containing protein [Paracoccaceae bacterium]
MANGQQMWGWANDLFPICRSITGPGVRQTLQYFSHLLPNFTIHSVPSGTQAFDWIVPDEWTVDDAYVEDSTGRRVIDFQRSNLHLMSYSIPVDQWMSLEDLDKHLYSLPEQPEAIPYVTSYYNRRWGFCLQHNDRLKLSDERYRVVIKTELKKGEMNYGELIIPGREKKEILLSTYICHPSLANNELSGPVVTTALAQWIASLHDRRYTYRIIFIPETIGSIVYISKHLEILKQRTEAGFIVTCVGDDRTYSYLSSRKGGTLADRAAVYALEQHTDHFESYSFLDRGSDERQFGSAKVDLPLCSIMRSRYGSYPEYHTSLDDMTLISPEGLEGAFEVLRTAISTLEMNRVLVANFPCEPHFSKYGQTTRLVGGAKVPMDQKLVSDMLAYADGTMDLLEMAKFFGQTIDDIDKVASLLESLDMVTAFSSLSAAQST